jgi:hypothetical protein
MLDGGLKNVVRAINSRIASHPAGMEITNIEDLVPRQGVCVYEALERHSMVGDSENQAEFQRSRQIHRI